ncbi:hypothetical protein SCHPADRAFT_892829 [Schizopora paradoxa]|uniref:Uncharacterized protein n=1 Tax=Schizopora paradoxa TaxID=27342 RepID=A0A0H2RDE4_9AGAM|nr:hypothetical protein SCHPADRAFT_892829 [Schizopora paradoxa]
MPLGNAHLSTRNVESRSRRSSRATSSSVLARTDGGNHEDGLVLRRRGLSLSSTVLGGLKAGYLKATPDRFVTAKQIADEIRRLLGHDKSTIYQRHQRYNEGDHPFLDHDELVSLCTKLANFLTKPRTRYFARSELCALFVEDPVVYDLFRDYAFTCLPAESYLFITKEVEENCHRRWSELLGRSTFKMNRRSETPQYNCDALKDTFNVSGRAAIEYLPYAMGLEMQNEDLVLLHQLWNKSLDYMVECYIGHHRVDNTDLCFKNIVSSGKPLAYFASPSQLERIMMDLVLHSTEVPFIFSTFFPPPMFEFRNPKDPYGAKLVIRSPARDWDIVSAATYAIPFLGAFAKEKIAKRFFSTRGKDFHALSEFIKKYGSGTPLEHTVLAKGEGAFIHLYEAVNDAATSYRRSRGVLSKLEENVHVALVTLVEPSLRTIVTGKPSWKEKKDWNVPRSNFIIAHTVDIDRYHKREMLNTFKYNDAYIDILNDRLRFQTYLQRSDGICNLTYIPQVRNVAYLRRFRIGLEYFITADGLPESNDRILNLRDLGAFSGDIVIDTMLLDRHVLSCLRVDGQSSVFNCRGHYPILAGFDFETKEPLFVSVVFKENYSPWYFTTVKNGASSVKYTDELGEDYISQHFFVLVLRHDPIDLPPQDIRHRAGAKDPTGPVYWVEFWPKKDAQYFSDERLRDDRLLKLLMNNLRTYKTAENILDGFNYWPLQMGRRIKHMKDNHIFTYVKLQLYDVGLLLRIPSEWIDLPELPAFTD